MYKIVGADQKEYGPVSEDQLRQWIAEGRANAQTITRFGEGPWKPLSTFPEFAQALGIPFTLTPPATPPLTQSTPIPAGPSTQAAAPQLNGLAVAGLTCSIFGLTCGMACCGPLFSTLGLVLSAVALAQLNQHPAQYSGRGLAIAGVVLGALGYLVFALVLSKGLVRRRFRRLPRFI